LLIFAILIVVEIILAPTYIEMKIEADGFAFNWTQPERTTVRVEDQNGWPARYFVSSLSSEVCSLDSASDRSLEAGLQAWAADNNWEIINPSAAGTCQEYARLGVDLEETQGNQITLKPLGWDEGLEWNATLCVVVIEGDPCGRITVTSIVPSFGVMIGGR
jgi:hypothetical protein